MAGLIEARRRTPTDDLISALLADSAGGPGLSDEELVANCVFLLWAGHETTKNLIGNGTLSLIRHPGELARLAADPTLLASAVAERSEERRVGEDSVSTCRLWWSPDP